MITQPIDVLKINKMSQEQYERELAAGRVNPNEIYVTPEGERVATLTAAVYFTEEWDDEVGSYNALMLGDKTEANGRMILLKKYDEMGGVRETNSLCAAIEEIFSARMVCISVLAGDHQQLVTPLIYKETVGSTMTWAGDCDNADTVPTDNYTDMTRIVWTDSQHASMPGWGPYAKYLKLSKALYDALWYAYNGGMDMSPDGEPQLVFTAYN